MSDVSDTWNKALDDAEDTFKALISSPSNEWKRVSSSAPDTTRKGSSSKGKTRLVPIPDVADVVVHRKGDDVYRLMLDVPADDEMFTLEPWRAVLTTPELRQEWDPAVSESHLVELIGQNRRISKTNFTLGWPASPRDAVTISRTMQDSSTFIDISTSLPRSPDEPAYLRPSPPYVRSHVSLLAWCIQHQKRKSSSSTTTTTAAAASSSSHRAKIRITCFWQHDLRAMWNIIGSSSSTLVQQLCTMLIGLVKCIHRRATRVPRLVGFGSGVDIEKLRFESDREALTVEYSVIPEQEEQSGGGGGYVGGIDVDALRDQRSVECVLPAVEGWDVQLTTRASSDEVESLPWNASAYKTTSYSSSLTSPSSGSSPSPTSPESPPPPPSPHPPLDQIILRITHSPLIVDDHSVLKVKLVLEISGPSSGLRLNGVPQRVKEAVETEGGADPSAPSSSGLYGRIGTRAGMGIWQDDTSSTLYASSTISSSFNGSGSGSGSTATPSIASGAGGGLPPTSSAAAASSAPHAPPLIRMLTSDSMRSSVVRGMGVGMGGVMGIERSASAQKTILSRVKRNYIYFSSLLQEPEAKWKRTTESRGVTITQLDSIDPTLVVYRAEATFVGVGLWDLYAAVVSPGAKNYWDKQHEDAVLLEDVNELTELWHLKSKPAWPVNGRDSVVLKTVYKSPTTIHVFSFSVSSPTPSTLTTSGTSSSATGTGPGTGPGSSSPVGYPSGISLEDQYLFPSTPIPFPDPNVIRTQIDLQGWSIEALSPTTTLLTLLEQSDPKGWTNNFNYTYKTNQMIGAIAGIGEFVIRSGGPPVVTRMSGGRKREVRYDVERGSFRLEYEPVGRGKGVTTPTPTLNPNSNLIPGFSTSTSTPLPTTQDASASIDASITSPTIECEIRCDVDTWAQSHSVDIVIDPPPQSVSCLRRHRLSDEGGGLWITIVHDAVLFVDEERLQVIVRRGLGGGGGGGGGGDVGKRERSNERERFGGGGIVMVNGAKQVVDVEELGEHEIKMLSKRKRVKPPRIPLDQPPVVGIVRRRRQEWDGAAPSSPLDETSLKGEGNISGVNPAGGAGGGGGSSSSSGSAPKVSSPLAKFFSYAIDQATSTTQQTIAAISPSGRSGDDTVAFVPGKMPAEYVLDVLAWTQIYHASTTPQAGWALISGDNETSTAGGGGSSGINSGSDGNSIGNGKPLSGLSIRRKLVTDLSPSIPIHKGEKVIEGFSAEELASVITEGECRKKWDERFVEEKSLEEFGSGVKTKFVVLRGGFPFRDRGFYTISLVARASAQGFLASFSSLSRTGSRDSRSSSVTAQGAAGTGGGGGGDAISRIGNRNAIFCVSTSFNPESASRFDLGKVNPTVFPIGRIYIDAWILETLDPYTKENYAIPSCRCTRLVAVDYAGNVPGAMNSMINASIPRAIAGVEAYVKSVSSLPITRLPPLGYVLAERKEEDVEAEVYGNVKLGWKLRRREANKMLVKTRYDPEKRVYTSTIIVRYPGSGTEDSGRSLVSPSKGASSSLSPTRHRSSSIHQQQITPKASRVGLDTLPESSSGDITLSSSSILSTHERNIPLPASPTTSSLSNTLSPSSSALRERTISGSGSATRGRSLAAFTLKGEVRPNTDLLVGEIVIDSRLYPKGYMVILRSQTRARTGMDKTQSPPRTSNNANATAKTGPLIPINLDSLLPTSNDVSSETSIGSASSASSSSSPSTTTSSSSSSKSNSNSGNSSGAESERKDLVLPFLYGLYTMPLSPLHSSGMNMISADDKSPTRHLLRLSLPTAQYEISTVRDPLTGETQHAPPKPKWLEEMEEGGVVITVEVRPLLKAVGSVGRGKVVVVDGMKPPTEAEEKEDGKAKAKEGKSGEGKVWNAERNGWEVAVLGEKESLTNLGREELMDDRVSRMGVLSRATNEADALPEGLSTAVAISDSLLDSNVMDTNNALANADNGKDGSLEDSKEKSSVSDSGGGGGSEEHSETALEPTDTATRPGHAPPSTGGSSGFRGGGRNLFFSFFPSYPYPNLLTRFTTSGTASMFNARPGDDGGPSDLATRDSSSSGGKYLSVGGATAGNGPRNTERSNHTGLYPVSTLIIIALIAFLIGSLFRSLLSPADFIYVVRDLQEAEEAQVLEMQNGRGVGWREMRRLFEIKYIIGGWDFQVAVVRRH